MDQINRQQKQIEEWLEIISDNSEEPIGGESDVGEENYENESNHSTDTEQDVNEESIFTGNLNFDSVNIYGRDETTLWKNILFRSNVRYCTENIFQNKPKLTEVSKNVKTPVESWELLFSFVEKIVECTNRYIEKEQQKYQRLRDALPTNIIEIRALLGLLYIAGLHKSSHTNVTDMWQADGTGLEIFIAIMS